VQRAKHDRVGADDVGSIAKALLGDAVFKVETRFINAQIVVERQHLRTASATSSNSLNETIVTIITDTSIE